MKDIFLKSIFNTCTFYDLLFLFNIFQHLYFKTVKYKIMKTLYSSSIYILFCLFLKVNCNFFPIEHFNALIKKTITEM